MKEVRRISKGDRAHKEPNEIVLQGDELHVGDIVLVHSSHGNVVCIVTRCADISCSICALNHCGCLLYRSGIPVASLGFVPLEEAVE